MRKIASLLILTACFGALATPDAAAQKKKSTPKAKSEKYNVVQVDAEYRVVKKSGMKALTAEVDAQYKTAQREYDAKAKEAKKAKTKFTDPRPKKKKIKIVKGNLASEQEANDVMAKLKGGGADDKGKGKTDKGDKGKGKTDKGDKGK
ncbi:MAG: hypothetical protein KDC87_00470 [Planctomycetes bacterium]|nr:hypothetical protein [Planctomycetota bacterium]MCB9869371.1 hypothetical protein [Planctomycetota bacterium]